MYVSASRDDLAGGRQESEAPHLAAARKRGGSGPSAKLFYELRAEYKVQKGFLTSRPYRTEQTKPAAGRPPFVHEYPGSANRRQRLEVEQHSEDNVASVHYHSNARAAENRKVHISVHLVQIREAQASQPNFKSIRRRTVN